MAKYLIEEEARKRASEVWPDRGYDLTGICGERNDFND